MTTQNLVHGSDAGRWEAGHIRLLSREGAPLRFHEDCTGILRNALPVLRQRG